jgi:predicted ester cyclase
MSSRHRIETFEPTRRAAFLTMAAVAAPSLAPNAAHAAEACSDAAEKAAFAILDRYVAIVNSRTPERLSEVCAENYIQHSGRSASGVAAQIENYRQIFERWPDRAMHVDDRIFGDGKLVARNTFTATHSRPVLGFAPTGRKVSYRAIDIWRVADGKLAEHWDIVDFAELEKQLRGS